jgi:PBP1b-binding outer membrane lipoprotein LpoB
LQIADQEYLEAIEAGAQHAQSQNVSAAAVCAELDSVMMDPEFDATGCSNHHPTLRKVQWSHVLSA